MHREAALFDALDATTSTTAKVEALAAYFREAADADKLWVIALLSGRRPKRPVTSTQLRQWAAEVSGIPDWLFEASYHVVGDFAETVTHIAKLEQRMERSLAEWVRYVEELKDLSEAEKAARVKAVWAGLEGMALFVFNKILTGGFRIGVSQKVMVKGLSKATGVDEDTLALMRKQGTFFVPTLAIMSPLGDPRGDNADAVALQLRTLHMMRPLRDAVRKARALGVTVAVGTDSSYGDGDDYGRVRPAHEIVELIGCGYTPLEAITAATYNSARVLGIEARTGSVAVGLEADLLVVDRDPRVDPTTLFEPLLVLSDGRVALDRLALR